MLIPQKMNVSEFKHRTYRGDLWQIIQYLFNDFQATGTEYLRCANTRNEEEMTISQSQNGSILKRLDLFPPQKSFTKASCFPFLWTTVINEDLLNERIYQQIIGSLLYISICTRSDLLPAVHVLPEKCLLRV